ncbi:MAG TPA: DNA-processing protein DprA [Mycobacteriales bacterium]|nr:DNA-processing protein DprA [Mycobacteriales bacterium]
MTEISAAERVARAALTRVVEPDDETVRVLVGRVGAADAWEMVRTGDPALPPRFRTRVATRVRAAEPERDLERAAAVGGRLVCPGDSEWPSTLGDLDSLDAAPLALWVRGTSATLADCDRSVAIVGSRAASAYGIHVSDGLAGGLADRGWATVSGGAMGIDGAAHRASLATGTLTVAVLACGVDVAYPPAHRGLLAAVASTGLIISEWPPGCSPMRHRFLIRNRLLAALSRGTVVVEAALRSGALSTARWAQRLGRQTMAVPGPVTSAMSGGCHQLLRETDATLVTCAAEVLEVVGELGADLAPRPQGAAVVRDSLGDEARRVIEATPVRQYVTPDRIAVTASMSPVRVASLLNQLCAQGLVEVSDAGFRLSAALRRTRRAGTTDET